MTIVGAIIHMNETRNTLIWNGRSAQYRGPLEVARPCPVQTPVRIGEISVDESGHPELASLALFKLQLLGSFPTGLVQRLSTGLTSRMQPLVSRSVYI